MLLKWGLLSEVLQLVKGSAGSNRGKEEGNFPSSPYTLHIGGRQYHPCPSHALRTGSSMLLSTKSTLLCYPGEVEGPFSGVLKLVREWVRPPPAVGVERWVKEGILPSPRLPHGRQEGLDLFSHSSTLMASSPMPLLTGSALLYCQGHISLLSAWPVMGSADLYSPILSVLIRVTDQIMAPGNHPDTDIWTWMAEGHPLQPVPQPYGVAGCCCYISATD